MTARPPLGLTADYTTLANLFAAARFTDATRLYAFAGDGLPELLVESFCGIESVCDRAGGAQWTVDVLSMQAGLPIRDWRFKQAALGIRQADGATRWRSGYVQTVQQLDADGGLARYRLTLVPGVWLATQARRNRVYQNQPLQQVIEDVLAPYSPYVRLAYDTGVDTLLAELAPRPMIVQYRETDYAFVTRLLAEEGLGWAGVEAGEASEVPDFSAGAAHVLRVFAGGEGFAEDAVSAAGGVRWHRAGSQETSDAVFDWRQRRSLRPNRTATVSWAWQHKRAMTAVEPSASRPAQVPALEVFADAHDSRQLTQDDAARYARLRQTYLDSSQWQLSCASTLRSLAVHRWFTLSDYAGFNATGFGQAGLDSPAATGDATATARFNVLAVLHLGINNLPRQDQETVRRGIAQLAEDCLRRAPHPALPQAGIAGLAPLLPAMLARLAATGYANGAQLLPRNLPVQPHLPRQPHVPAGFTLPARVVGPQSETVPGSEEIYADAHNRVRVAFFWQKGANANDRSTCWVPVMQRAAGPTRGVHVLPRIGQEVLVGFMNGQLDQPVVLASAYNGRGEGSRFAREDRAGLDAAREDRAEQDAKSGQTASGASPSPFAQSVDARIAGQSNRVGAGNSPAWHGAAGAEHNHAAALLGLRSKEWGGIGFNQLLFDDSDHQLAVQLATTQLTTQLNLGHLRHRADNYRGSFRGLGFELRTDGYGALRARQGLLVTTWGKDAATPTGDAAAAQRLLQTAAETGRNLSEAATTHQTLRFSAVAGLSQASRSSLREDRAPLAALHHAASGMVAGKDRGQAMSDAAAQHTGTTADKVPHSSDPILTVAGRGGIGLTATEVQTATGQTHSEIAGQHRFTGVAGDTRLHSGQGIGLMGGAIQAANGIGLEVIAGNGDILTQAQSDTLTVASQKDLTIAAGQPIDFAAAKKIVLATAGGARIEIGSSGINVTAPGAFTVHAAGHQFVSGGGVGYGLPVMPVAEIVPEPQRQLASTFAYDQLKGIAQRGTKAEFIALLAPIFGFDIPAKTYIKLYDGLRSGAIQNPTIKLMSGGHYPAEFDNDTREIRVHWFAAKRAATDREENWLLLTALLHEFGHYVDTVLRHDLADKNPDGSSMLARDAAGDEGAKYAYEVAFFDLAGSTSTVYADYSSPEYSGPLKVNYAEARNAIRQSQSEEAQRQEGKSGSTEYFSAGRGEHYKERPNESFGHASIEDVLVEADRRFVSRESRRQIYFGNWLRDYSQLLDPKIVRKPSAPKDLTRYLSRDALTKIVAVLAEDEFVKKPGDKAVFAVTPQRLGVYRPTEHIDNPTNNDPKAVIPQTVDADFEPLPTKASLAVDPATSMKRYIAASSAYMQGELNAAASAGPNANGFRHFGAALHVLEDYFAHSNFVELSLRKVGHTRVLPWTSPAPGKHKYPVVTGMFDSEDVIASTAGMIADTIFKVEWEFQAVKPGERNKSDRLMLIILGEHSDPSYLKAFEQFLWLRDQYAKLPGSEYLQRLMHYTFGMVGNAYNFVYGSLLHLVGNSVDDEQVLRTGDPNTNGSTDPSHSQLAKDHDNHPLHTLAVTLAKYAVKDVGRAMAARWAGDATANPAKVAAAYLVHPMECSWQDSIVSGWAGAHPRELKRGESATEWEALRKEHEQEVRKGIQRAGQRSKAVWDYLNENYETIFGEKNQVKK